MSNKSGKAGVTIVILGAIILVALVPWYFVLSRHFSNDDTPGQTPPPAEESPLVDSEPEAGQTPDPEPEPEPAPLPPVEQEAEEEPEYEETVAGIAETHPGLLKELNNVASQYNCISASLVVFDGDTGEYFTYEYGYADKDERQKANIDTKFRVASLAKLTTAVCAMKLVDEDLLDLDTDISTYFGYEVININFPETQITARMLMQHTSSLFDSGAFQVSRDRNSSEPVRYLIEIGSSFRRNRPGTHFEYSNFGYAVLGALCERVSGKTLDTLAREVLFEPLDIDAAYVPDRLLDTENIAVLYNSDHTATQSVQAQLDIGESELLGHDLHLAQGNLTISMLDYARILAMLINGGALGGVRILSAEAVNDMHNANVQGIDYKQGLATRFSSGDFIEHEDFYWHTGSSFGLFAQYVYSKEINRGVVSVTTGATIERSESGMIDVCTELSRIAWSVFDIEEEE